MKRILFLILLMAGASQLKAQHLELGSDKFIKMERRSFYLGEPWTFTYANNGLSLRYRPWNNSNYKEVIFVGSNRLVGFFKNNPSYKLDIQGDVASKQMYTQSSDVRYKSNITSLIDCLSKLKDISGKSYEKKSAKGEEFGFLAQDIAKLFPELVYEDNEGYLSINYAGFLPIIIEAIKEQRSSIQTQEAEIQVLSKKIMSK